MSKRRIYLDNLKVVLIAAIIAIHGVLGYAGFIEVWSYTEVREVTLSPVTETVVSILVAPFGFFMMALLFLVAGLLSPPSLERKGSGVYVRDRLLRLGVPFVAYVLIVQPAVMYGLEHPLGAAPRSYWYEFLFRHGQRLGRGGRVRTAAGHHRDRWRLPADVRSGGGSGSQGDASRVHHVW